MSPADDIQLHPGFLPEPVMRIARPETLRVISDPTRMRLMEVMVQRQEPPWSVRELAAALDVPQTRLYHHVEQLLAHGIVRAVERRVVSGIIETRYRVAALSFQLDRRLFEGATDAATQMLHDTLVAVFDTARDEIEAAMRDGALDPEGSVEDERILVARSLATMTPARATQFRRRLVALQEEFCADMPAGSPGDGTRPWGVVLAVYPLPETSTPTDSDPAELTDD
jgi:DNA-binding transcriptional ArsR family regulator